MKNLYKIPFVIFCLSFIIISCSNETEIIDERNENIQEPSLTEHNSSTQYQRNGIVDNTEKVNIIIESLDSTLDFAIAKKGNVSEIELGNYYIEEFLDRGGDTIPINQVPVIDNLSQEYFEYSEKIENLKFVSSKEYSRNLSIIKEEIISRDDITLQEQQILSDRIVFLNGLGSWLADIDNEYEIESDDYDWIDCILGTGATAVAGAGAGCGTGAAVLTPIGTFIGSLYGNPQAGGAIGAALGCAGGALVGGLAGGILGYYNFCF